MFTQLQKGDSATLLLYLGGDPKRQGFFQAYTTPIEGYGGLLVCLCLCYVVYDLVNLSTWGGLCLKKTPVTARHEKAPIL